MENQTEKIEKNVKKERISLQDSQAIHFQYAEQMSIVIGKLKEKLKNTTDDVEKMRLEYEIQAKENYRKIFVERIATKADVNSK